MLLCAYATGRTSSSSIEQGAYDDLAFRYLAADQHPNHDTIASFRQQHLEAMARLFVQALHLCQRAGLAKLAHVAMGVKKVRANASTHRSLRYQQLREEEQRWRQIVTRLLAEATRVDEEEDQRYGKGQKHQALPPAGGHGAHRRAERRQASVPARDIHCRLVRLPIGHSSPL